MASKKPTKKTKVIYGEVVESREAPIERAIEKAQIISPQLNDKQLALLMNRTPQWAIKRRQGPGGKMYSYVPHGYVTDMLNKAFGWDWDLIVDPMSDSKMYALEIEETPVLKAGRPTGEILVTRHVAVAGHLTVRAHSKTGAIIATITKSGFGSQKWLPTMEFGDALKGAKSDLLKVCAVQLGVALDLYWNEQVELQEFETKEEQRAEAQRQADEMAKNMSGAPKTPVIFISRCMSELGLSLEDAATKLGIVSAQIMVMPEEELAKCWELLKVKNA